MVLDVNYPRVAAGAKATGAVAAPTADQVALTDLAADPEAPSPSYGVAAVPAPAGQP